MARYFLNVVNSGGRVTDEEGEELADLDGARESAVATVRSIVSDESKQGRVDLRGRIEVTDASGDLLLILPFSEAIEVLTGPPPASHATPGVAL